ncbi:MAG: hypothetical protein ACLP1X_15555 [Polyangiaceae bacterium]
MRASAPSSPARSSSRTLPPTRASASGWPAGATRARRTTWCLARFMQTGEATPLVTSMFLHARPVSFTSAATC